MVWDSHVKIQEGNKSFSSATGEADNGVVSFRKLTFSVPVTKSNAPAPDTSLKFFLQVGFPFKPTLDSSILYSLMYSLNFLFKSLKVRQVLHYSFKISLALLIPRHS